MADLVRVTIPRTVVEEETTFSATAYFRQQSDDSESAPTTVHYKVTDLTTNTTIVGWTSISAAASVTIPITSTMNAIQQGSSKREHRQLLVQADRGLSTQVTGRRVWKVENFKGINDNS